MSRRIGIAAAIWGASILLTKVIGLVREAVIGRVLGGGSDADLYFLAFTLPDALGYLLAGGALSIVFIPLFAGYIARDDEEGAWTSFSLIANAVGLGLLVFGGLLWALVPTLAPLVGPGLDPVALAELVLLTRIMLPAQAFHLLGGLLSAALQARDRHALPALAPLLYTVCIIGGGLLGGAEAGARGFAWGVLVGSALGPFLLPLVGCIRMGMRWRPVLSPRHPDLRTWLWRSLPVMVAFSIIVYDDMILRREASLLGDGAVATLEYAKKLMKVPMGVFGLAAGVAAYPTLSRLVGEGDKAGAYRSLSEAVRRMLVLAFGAQVVLTAAGPQLSRLVYGARIDAEQHAAIGAALSVFGLALWAWAAQTLLSRGFYVLGKTWLPSLLGTLVVFLAYPIYHLAGQGLGTLGLAAASTFAVTVYVLILGLLLRREYPGVPDGFGAFALRVIPSVALGVAVPTAAQALGLDLGAALPQAAVLGALGGASYLLAALALRLTEAREVLALVGGRLRRRLRRGTPGREA
ncbi:virulence factor MviN [Myxococcota bacterium]|nr:virulence factor MviN [Myxococcota bacterium]